MALSEILTTLTHFVELLGSTPKELTIFAGKSVTIHEEATYGLVMMQGQGTVGKMEVESPNLVRLGQLLADELFVSVQAAPAVKSPTGAGMKT